MVERANFGPLPYSGKGEAEGQAVFVGYGVSSDPKEDGSVEYDDLAGLELEGKVAVLLLDAPGQPNYREVMEFLQAEADAFAKAAGPLVDAEDEKGMRSLHRETRERISGAISASCAASHFPTPTGRSTNPWSASSTSFVCSGR